MIEIIILLILALFPGIDGIYVPAFDYIVCDHPIICAHEKGHRLDFKSGLPSQTPEFKKAVNENLPILLENTSCVIETESCLYAEAYAGLYAISISNGYVFKEFIEFYKD